MYEFFHGILVIVKDHQTVVVWITVGSAVGFLLTLLVAPWLLIKLPKDYFSTPETNDLNLLGNHPIAKVVINGFRNTIGFGLILIGVLLLILPGQGLLTILLGIAIANFPGKRKLIQMITSRSSVQRSLNWLRRKAGKENFEFRQTPSG